MQMKRFQGGSQSQAGAEVGFRKTNIWSSDRRLYFIFIFYRLETVAFAGGGWSRFSSAQTTSGILKTQLGKKKKGEKRITPFS